MDKNLNLNQNTEINKALQEFEEQDGLQAPSQVTQTEEVLGVPKITQLMMRWFHIKKRKTMEYLMLAIAVIFLVTSFYFFSRTLSPQSNSNPNLSQEDINNLPPEFQRAILNGK